MEIIIKEVSIEELKQYRQIPMEFEVKSKYQLTKIDGGLGGIIFKEVEVEAYTKDLGQFEDPLDWGKTFDISNWGFIIAFDNGEPVAGATLVYNTEGVNMLSNRKDLVVLWDIRVASEYKSKGIGSQLIFYAKEWAKARNCKQIKIETQNNNVAACKFYAKQGAKLGEVNEYAYYGEFDDEAMLVWYLDLE